MSESARATQVFFTDLCLLSPAGGRVPPVLPLCFAAGPRLPPPGATMPLGGHDFHPALSPMFPCRSPSPVPRARRRAQSHPTRQPRPSASPRPSARQRRPWPRQPQVGAGPGCSSPLLPLPPPPLCSAGPGPGSRRWMQALGAAHPSFPYLPPSSAACPPTAPGALRGTQVVLILSLCFSPPPPCSVPCLRPDRPAGCPGSAASAPNRADPSRARNRQRASGAAVHVRNDRDLGITEH